MAVAAAISMLAVFMGAYGLYLRIQEASCEWKEEIACLLFSASAAGGAGDGMIRTTPSGTGIRNRGEKGIVGQFRASRASMAEWDQGKVTRDVTIFSRPASRGVTTEAEMYEIPEENGVAVTRDADLEPGVTYTRRA